MTKSGQIILFLALTLMVFLLMFALIVDSSRILVERISLARLADTVSKSGLFPVAEAISTRAFIRQTESAEKGCPDDTTQPHVTCTSTPRPEQLFDWLKEDDYQFLVSSSLQTAVVHEVENTLLRNGFNGSGNQEIVLAVTYPEHFTMDDRKVRIRVVLKKKVRTLFLGLKNAGWMQLSQESIQILSLTR